MNCFHQPDFLAFFFILLQDYLHFKTKFTTTRKLGF